MANHVLLQKITLTQSTASITFANIPQTGYTDLKLVISSRQTVANASGGYYYDITFNNTSSNRSGRYLEGANGTTVFSATYTPWGLSTPSDFTANTFSNNEIYIPNYAGSNYKSLSSDAVNENNASAARLDLIAGLWSDTAAINSITLTPGGGSFVANSTFSLYGIAATGTSPSSGPKASGGNTITTDGTYWSHTFLTSGTFTPITTLSCDYLVVAGGGGGGGGAGSVAAAGAGAGGFRTGTAFSVTAIPYEITIGAGGSGGPGATAGGAGTNGSNSTFSSITSTGGGTGSTQSGVNPGGAGGSGGSGGGGSWNFSGGIAGPGGAASPSGQGNVGGTGNQSRGGAGGGGAGQAGSSSVSNSFFDGQSGFNGGNGLSNSYSGSAVTYAGGGGGGGQSPDTTTRSGGSGGTGGGGAGGTAIGSGTNSATAGGNGSANTGGGGGGGSVANSVTFGAGGSGGSGIVIIRYPV
jgi:hypothetical protein